jgi:Tol biopolymer transport system component
MKNLSLREVGKAPRTFRGLTLGLSLIFATPFVSLQAQPTSVTRILDSSATLAVSSPSFSSISADGRYVVYVAYSTQATTRLVYRWDRTTGTASLVSKAPDNSAANGSSGRTAISADGRYVAYVSSATNLVTGDTNDFSDDIFLRDASADTTIKLSNLSDDDYLYAGPFFGASRYVAYQFYKDSDSSISLVIYDIETASSTTVTTGISGGILDGISADARYVLVTVAPDSGIGGSIQLFDRQTSTAARVDQNSSSVAANAPAYSPVMSQDGRYVAFYSNATNLVAPDTNKFADVFLKDMQTGAIVKVSLGADGSQATADCDESIGISSDGRYITFSCSATNLLFGVNNGFEHVYLYDRTTEGLKLLSASASNAVGDDSTSFGLLSADASSLLLFSEATNLISGDTNAREDPFLVATGAPVEKDNCPSDSSKTAPGTCGCGISDADSNGNGLADCQDPDGNTVPSSAATVQALKKKKIRITFPAGPITGLQYDYIVTRGNKIIASGATASTTLTEKLAGTGRVSIRYRFVYADGTMSQLSPAASVTIKRLRR